MTIKSQGGVFGRNPTFNDVEVEGSLTVGGSAALVASNIGSTVQAYDADTAKLDVVQTFTANQTVSGTLTAQILDAFEGSSTTQLRVGASASYYWDISRDNVSTGDLVISNYNANSVTERARFKTGGNLAFPSGNGIDFSATAGTGTSELFDDYEEGTWTPVVSDGTNNATMNASTAGSYTKIGNTVFFRARARVSALGSVSGAVRVTGLPFTIANDQSNYSGGSILGDGLNITAGQSLMYLTIIGANYLSLYLTDVTTGISALDAAELSATGDLYFSGQYYV
jgi:hypothetical protein